LKKEGEMMDRNEVLSKAAELISGDRQATYGDAKEMHQLIGDLWSSYLGVEVGAVDVAALMVLMKVARSKGPQKHSDNFVDICGYASLACEMQESN
jgi:hypothetical protein